MKNTKKNKRNKLLVAALGKGAREIYLEDNPHGFKRGYAVTKNNKKYSRKNKNADGY